MKFPISARLRSCCDLVRPGQRVADVGCDHGYLGMYLLQSGTASHVIASDIRPGPLASAVRNAEKYGFTDKMSFFLSDGVQSICRDFDVLVCAGMGADTIIRILSDAPWLQGGAYRLILQCQSKTHCLRKYLWENGWEITTETAQKDGRFVYTVIEASWAPGATFTPGQCYLSPALLANNTQDTRDYCARILSGLKQAVDCQGDQADPFCVSAFQELSSKEDML